MNHTSVAVLVPAHNEEKVLAHTLQSLVALRPGADIFVVDDGSQDQTSAIARGYTPYVLTLPKSSGKAEALNMGIDYFQLTDRYEYIMFMDADTQVAPDFLERALPHFASDPDISCVVGRVQSLGGSWIANYRLWEYTVAHGIHKRAQSHLEAILVVPGCATVYASDIFRYIRVPSGTLTEDMDFTFLMHRIGRGRMHFEDAAVVYTQDPQRLKDFVRQIWRWYMGFWQTVRKHNLPWEGQNLDFEVAVLATEGLLNGFVGFAVVTAIPMLIAMRAFNVMAIPVLIDFCAFFIPTLLWSAVKTRRYLLPLYILHFYFLRLVTSLIFLGSFFKAYASREQQYIWDTQRYPLDLPKSI